MCRKNFIGKPFSKARKIVPMSKIILTHYHRKLYIGENNHNMYSEKKTEQ